MLRLSFGELQAHQEVEGSMVFHAGNVSRIFDFTPCHDAPILIALRFDVLTVIRQVPIGK